MLIVRMARAPLQREVDERLVYVPFTRKYTQEGNRKAGGRGDLKRWSNFGAGSWGFGLKSRSVY